MKICVLSDSIVPGRQGGASLIAWNIAVEFSRCGHDVTVITSTTDDVPIADIRAGGVRLITIPSGYDARWRGWRSLYNPGPVRELRRLFAEIKPDIVNIHNIHGYLSYYSFVIARRHTTHVYMTAHDVMSFHYGKLTPPERRDGTYPTAVPYRQSWVRELMLYRRQYNPFRKTVIAFILKRYAAGIVAVSGALKDALDQNGIGKVTVIRNGIEIDGWKDTVQETAAFKSRHAVGDSAILFAGRLSGDKGGYKILEMLQRIARSVPSVQLIVAGAKDSYTERMVTYAAKLGVAERVVFTGWISGDELRAAYHASAVVAVPSLYLDPFPTINLEAMACSKPVVATCFGGSPEIVEDGVTGYIENPFDVEAFAARIMELLTDDSLRDQFGAAGRRRVEESFTLRDQAQKYLALMGAGDDTDHAPADTGKEHEI